MSQRIRPTGQCVTDSWSDTEAKATVLWSFMSQRGCYEPALPIVDELLERGHEVIGLTTDPSSCPLPWPIEMLSDRFAAPPTGLPAVGPGPPADLDAALRGMAFLAGWHMAEVCQIVAERQVDVVLADGLRLGAGLAAERCGVPWVAYTHHYFDEAGSSEAMVEWYCQCFGCAGDAAEVFARWWPGLLDALGAAPEGRPVAERCWWNLSPQTTLVLGLPELKVHAHPAPDYVHRVGPSLWNPPLTTSPGWLPGLGRDRPAVLVSLSTNPVPDAPLALLGAQAWADEADVVVTAGSKALPALPPSVIVAGDFPHAHLMGRVAAVACSAGHGIVTRAACAGVGVLAAPQMGDQPLVAEAVTTSGLGFATHPEELSAEWLADGLEGLLGGQRGTAERLRQAAGRYRAPCEAAELVERLLSC